jgi:hypothetical protein
MRTILICTLCFISLLSCNKQEEWLDIKSNRADVTPTTIKDFQSILDYPDFMNDGHPGIPLASSDNYYVLSTTWQADASYSKNVYVWAAKDFYLNVASVNDWSAPYTTVEYANIALDGLRKITPTTDNQQAWNICKGAALFYRSFAFFNLVSTFAKQYNAATAATDLGIPLRLNADVNERSVRASVQDTYDRIINDLKEALPLITCRAFVPDTRINIRCECIAGKGLLKYGRLCECRFACRQSIKWFTYITGFQHAFYHSFLPDAGVPTQS